MNDFKKAFIYITAAWLLSLGVNFYLLYRVSTCGG